MSEDSVRFTAWLSASEAQGIEDMAQEYGTSRNYIVRVAIRQLLGFPVIGQLSQLSRVTNEGEAET